MEQSQKTRNSHVQVTHSLLQAFSHRTEDGKQVWYLDFSDWQIKQQKIRILGTQQEFYSPEMEDFLAKEVESKVGELFASLRGFSKSGQYEQIQFSIQDVASIRAFFAYSFIRGRGVLEETKKCSKLAEYLLKGGIKTEDILLFPERAIELFNVFYPSVIINRTDVPFVIPSSCIYTSPPEHFSKDKPFWVLPLSPACAILLIHQTKREKFPKSYYTIDDPCLLNAYNEQAFRGEYTQSKRFLAGDPKELERVFHFFLRYLQSK